LTALLIYHVIWYRKAGVKMTLLMCLLEGCSDIADSQAWDTRQPTSTASTTDATNNTDNVPALAAGAALLLLLQLLLGTCEKSHIFCRIKSQMESGIKI